MPLTHRVRATVVATALLATCLVAMPAQVGAAPEADTTATGSSGTPCRSGPRLRYLVVLDQQTPKADAEQQVAANCGTLAAYYPEIGVAVASSADAEFAERLGPERAFSAQAAVRQRAARLSQRGGTGSAKQQDSLARSGSTPSTADRSDEQWDMAMIGADQANKVNPGSRDVLVGVLDSGIDATHPDLMPALDQAASAGCLSGQADPRREAWVPTAFQHGTHVAGTIAAADDGKGTVGVAPGVRLASVKVVDDDGYIYPESAVCGFMWAAAKGMRVVNNSFLIDPWVLTCKDRDGSRVVYEAVRRAVSYATKRGVLAVAAVGNEGIDLANPAGTAGRLADAADRDAPVDNRCEALPAELPGVVAVASVGAKRLKASYSSYGLGKAQVAAPGGDYRQPLDGTDQGCVLSTVPGGYGYQCGTSMATPHVTGVAALLASRYPSAGPSQLSRLLGQQATTMACPADYDLNSDGVQDATCHGYTEYNGFYGHGMVDALEAVSH